MLDFIDGGVSRAAKGADCKSAGLRLRRFESYLPHHRWNVHHKLWLSCRRLLPSFKSLFDGYDPTVWVTECDLLGPRRVDPIDKIAGERFPVRSWL